MRLRNYTIFAYTSNDSKFGSQNGNPNEGLILTKVNMDRILHAEEIDHVSLACGLSLITEYGTSYTGFRREDGLLGSENFLLTYK
ncbi:hypothetical protein SADUNF_Sadunf05G0099300 [Salix dunnii]|uniref:Uncharacterized protein n=1 Tax=Salix dunnii TaxID=1413687 RepID=A0A835K4I5_9ROSI|nr:hypothetical protein SADUNF_Sadunf05G0099300 [Salix dunnii]